MHPRVLGTWPVTLPVILLTVGIPFNSAYPAGDAEIWHPRKQGRFIVSLCEDNDGGIWVGTEGNGLWRKAPDEDNWTHVTRASTGGFAEELGPVLTTGTAAETCLGDDNIYALACDRRGRIWAGHLNHGVSVFNGTAWRNYDVLSGPLGERVFDIAVCPVDGDVWIASDAGLARYREKQDTWSYYTRADGLPEDQANSLAFDKSGRLFVGTQCHGIAVAPARKEARGRLAYPRWRVVSAPERFGPGKKWQLPLSPAGNGLPTNMINQVLVGRDGTVWAATMAGLAFSRDGGRSWRYIRGKNFVAKVEKSWAGTPPGWKRPPRNVMQRLLPEDYITCLA
ncbi:MAG: two-component regulator propeller domain-containing protein, partial [Candidatus Hydrogenedentes bacterium]|nr:two-component regulator propeller domain-containing protein [Candidatus Hydrogenedentota bacterium]